MTFLAVQNLNANTNSSVPEVVTKSFQKKYPKVTNVSWDDYGELFIASFFGENDQPIEATFDANGNWNETITIMEEGDLPETITSYISKKYSEDSEIFEISFSEKPAGSFYFVSIEVSSDDEDVESETWMLTFDKAGKFLEKE
jgi:hypothetical protein